MTIKDDDKWKDQYGNEVYIATHKRHPQGFVYDGSKEGGWYRGQHDAQPFEEIYDMKLNMLITETTPVEPYIDKAARNASTPWIITGGSFGNDGLWVANGGDTQLSMTAPEKLGKWEYWNIEAAGGLRKFFQEAKYKMPTDYGKDDCLILGSGRGILGFYLGKTGLENNNGIFNNVTLVEEDEELVDYTKTIISDTSITNINALCNRSLEETAPRTADYETMLSKKYDVIIATLPFSNQSAGIYHINQQIRTSKQMIDNGERATGPDWPFSKTRDFYDGVAKFEDKCYDENFNRHNVMFSNARKFLKPGGYLVSVHNAFASDVDTFMPMIEKAGMELVHHTIIDKGMGGHSHARHWFLRTMLVHPNVGNQWVMVTKVK